MATKDVSLQAIIDEVKIEISLTVERKSRSILVTAA
jgi:hypothetical protein